MSPTLPALHLDTMDQVEVIKTGPNMSEDSQGSTNSPNSDLSR